MTSNQLEEKLTILKSEGFHILWERDLFFHPERRICFSLEFLEDNSLKEVKRRAGEVGSPPDITFHFSLSPNHESRILLEEILTEHFLSGKSS